MKCKKSKKAKLMLACIFLCFGLLIAFEVWKINAFGIGRESSSAALITSLIGSLLFVLMIMYDSFTPILRIDLKALPRHLLFALPCFAVAVNNFPLIPFFSGKATVSGKGTELLMWLLVCLGTGLFEEMVFRGYILMTLLEKQKNNRKGIFTAVILSSVIFGLIHLINLLGGSDPFATVLQVGYSFLVGGMCAVVLLKTGSIWYPVLLHAIYNFAGGIIPRFGEGVMWDAPTVVITVILAVLAFLYLLFALIKTDIKNLTLPPFSYVSGSCKY